MIEIGFKPPSFPSSLAPPYPHTVSTVLQDLSPYGSSIPSRVLVENGMRLVRYWIFGKAATNGVQGSVSAGLYVADGTTNKAGSLAHSALITTEISTDAWYSVDVNFDLSEYAGSYIKPAIGNAEMARIRFLTMTEGDSERATDQNLPSPMNGSSTNIAFGVYVEIEQDADPDPTPEIDPTGTDTTLVNGSSQQISFTGLTATPTSVSLVHGGNAFEQPNFSIGAVTGGVATANFTAAIGNLPYTSSAYPASGFSYLVAGDNGTEMTLSGITINPSADRSVVTAVNPINDSFSIIPLWVEGGAVTGDQIDWPKVVGNIQPTVNADFSHLGDRIDKNIPWPDSIKFTVNYWDSVDRIRYAVALEVAYAEDGTGTVINSSVMQIKGRSMSATKMVASPMIATPIGA